MPQVTKKKKVVKRKLKKEAIFIGIAIILLLYIAFNIPSLFDSNKLKKLGYDKEAITAIEKMKLSNTLLENDWYSENLNNAVKQDGFRSDLLELYIATKEVTNDDILLYDKLIKNYTKEELIPLFNQCEFYEITPLLVFDKVSDIPAYIADVRSNRATNSINAFQLTNSYITPYAITEPVTNPGTITMLVNKHYYLEETFTPVNLVDMSIRYASKGIQMSSEAYDAFVLMAEAMKEQGMNMYASSTYRTYEYQTNLYNDYVKRDGEEGADTYAARPGFSEHQTGLTADVAFTGGGLSTFGESSEYQWMIVNAHTYGWILRYPEGKESITGYEAEPWHWRYVGVDTATKVYQSGLTYDEYYLLHIAD